MAKATIETVGYADFSLRIHEQLVSKRVPSQGSIDLTSRCNLNCVHCYINLPSHDEAAQGSEFSASEICRLLDDIAEAGCLWLCLTGGEPLLRKDFAEIYLCAKKKGFILTLFTNATLLTEKAADLLAEWRPFNIEVTIYGSTRETYEAVTRVRGSFDKCMKGIQRIMDRRLPLSLKSMAMETNKREVFAMQQFADSLGVKFRFDPLLNRRLDAKPGPERVRLSAEEAVELDLAFEKRVDEWNRFCEKFSPSNAPDERLFVCGAGLNNFHISSDGKLCVCPLYQVDTCDLRQGTFVEGWRELSDRVRGKKRTRPSECPKCPVMPMCNQCPGWAYLEHADPEARVEYLCRIARLRAARLKPRKVGR